MTAKDAQVTVPTATFGTGKDRGDLLQFRADYKINPEWKGHVLYEHIAPGTFYAGQSSGYFLRLEFSYLFKNRI